MPELIDLLQADDPRDVAQRAVACLARGGVVALASGPGYALVASLADPDAAARIGGWLDAIGGPDATDEADREAVLLLKGAGELADWADLAASPARRLPARAWPGPVTLRLRPCEAGLADRLPAPARGAVVRDGWLSARAPADRLTREILRLSAGPLLQFDGRPAGRGLSREDVGRIDGVAMVLDAGESPRGALPTVVAVDHSGWSVVRPGAVAERQVEEWAAVIILFVCTGNTCRSPMAEALCKATLARRLGCAADDLPRRGFVVRSAGVAASPGMPAADNAVAVVRGRGGSLADHASQAITPALVHHADHILAMTWDHLDAVLDQVPDAAHRIRLLDAAGGDIPDPVGMDEGTYRETAREIERHLEQLMVELGL